AARRQGDRAFRLARSSGPGRLRQKSRPVGGFFNYSEILFAPGTVEIPVLVDPLEAVRAEEIALALDEIGGAKRLRKTVEIAERRAQCRQRQASERRLGDDLAK